MPLSNVIENIQRASFELADDNRQYRSDLLACATDYIKDADAHECLLLINELIERVSSITGMAKGLEDDACMLERHIESEAEDD